MNGVTEALLTHQCQGKSVPGVILFRVSWSTAALSYSDDVCRPGAYHWISWLVEKHSVSQIIPTKPVN